MSDTRTAIKDTLSDLTSLRKVERHLSTVVADIEAQTVVVADLGKVLDRELKDFERLQGLSVKGLFYKALGSKEQQIEKERQDYLKANLTYQAEVDNLDLMQYEAEVLAQKVQEIEPVETKLAALYKVRTEEILRSNDATARELRVIYDRIDSLTIYARELAEADQAGRVSAAAGHTVVSHLDNALRWGQWDMSQRGSGRYDYQKRSAIDRAIRAATEMQRSLVLFGRELNDVGLNDGQLQVNLDIQQGFMSVFFDNLISDWILQQRITKARSTVSNVISKVSDILHTIKQENTDILIELQKLEVSRKKILSQ